MASVRLPSSEGWVDRPLWGRRELPGKPGGLRGEILFQSKESPLALPKKDSGGVSIPPPDPSYDQRKGCGPSFGNHPEEYGGFRYEGRWDGGWGRGDCGRLGPFALRETRLGRAW